MALETQVGGKHYKDMAIQPVEFIHKNKIGFCEGSAIKYLCRWRSKGGVEDLRKARHFIDLLIELETPPCPVSAATWPAPTPVPGNQPEPWLASQPIQIVTSDGGANTDRYPSCAWWQTDDRDIYALGPHVNHISKLHADGLWIEWCGGIDAPKTGNARVQGWRRDGKITEVRDNSIDFDWTHSNRASDIIAYRTVKP